MTAIRVNGKFTRLSPSLIAPLATRNQKLKVQQETMKERVERMEYRNPSRGRVIAARSRGYRGPLTREDLAKLVR